MTTRTRKPTTGLTARARERSSHEGQALVEFAVVGLLLALMLFGVVEIGRAYFASIAVTNAARDAARVAMDPDRPDADVISAGHNAAGDVTLTSLDISRSYTIGDTSTVTATVDFETDVPLVSQIWGGGPLTLSSTATSRVGWQ